jgi:arabinofuranosyltransferase
MRLVIFFAASFLAIFMDGIEFSPKRVFWLTMFAMLAIFNRMDTILLFLPALIYAIWKSPDRKNSLGYVILGSMPFLLWEVFSLFYYGFSISEHSLCEDEYWDRSA